MTVIDLRRHAWILIAYNLYADSVGIQAIVFGRWYYESQSELMQELYTPVILATVSASRVSAKWGYEDIFVTTVSSGS